MVTRRPRDHLARILEHLAAVDEQAPARRLAAEIEVRRHVAAVDQREVLEDGGDAELARLVRIGDPDRLPGDLDLAPVGLVNAAEDLGQRRLAGAVVADDREDLVLVNVERHVTQCADMAKALGQIRALAEILRALRSASAFFPGDLTFSRAPHLGASRETLPRQLVGRDAFVEGRRVSPPSSADRGCSRDVAVRLCLRLPDRRPLLDALEIRLHEGPSPVRIVG